MSRREVKASIHRQILMVFFLPLITACVHIGMAFPLMKRLLLLVGMSNTRLFLICTAVTVIIFAAVYGVIYAVTAKILLQDFGKSRVKERWKKRADMREFISARFHGLPGK